MTIYELVARERARIARLVQLDTSLRVAIACVSVLSFGAVVLGGARWIELPRIAPFVVWAVAAALAVEVARRGARRLGDLTSPAAIAGAVERERRLRAGSLRGLLELAGHGGAFVRRAAQRLAVELAALGNVLAPSLQRRLRRGALAGAAVLLPLTFLAAFATARRPDGWQALAHPLAAWRGTLLPRLGFDDVPRRAMRGTMVRFTVRASGRSHVSLRRRTTGNAWVETSIPVARGAAVTEVGPLDADLTLVASDGRSSSDTLVVRVVDRPFVGDVALRANYPGYLRRAAEALAIDGPVKVPGGTELWIEGHASEPLSAVALAQGRDSVRLTPNDRRFTGRFTPAASGSWTWSARGRSASIAEVPPPLDVEVVADSAPSAEILIPAADTTVSRVAKVELQLVASDDHGLQAVTLKIWRVGHDGQSTSPAAQKVAGGGISEWSGRATLDVASFGLEAGDAVHVQLVARDETPWGQEGTSRELVLRVLGESEQRSSLRASADAAALSAASAAKEQAQLQQRTSEASSQRNRSGDKGGDRANSEMKYEGAQQAKQLASEQKQMSERVQQLQQAAKQLEERLRSAGALDTGLASQLRRAQELLKQALTPEMLEALKKLDNSTQQLSADQTRQSLADLVAQQKKLREALEKTAEILNRAALEGALQTLRDEADDLAKEQRERSDSAGKPGPPPQEQLSSRTEQLSKDIQELMQRLKREGADTAARQAQRAREQTQKALKAMSQQTPGRKAGEQKTAGERQEARKGEEQKAGGEKKQEGQQSGEQQSGQQSGQQQVGQESGRQSGQAGGEEGGMSGAEQAAEAMESAAQALAEGRKAQVDQWKQELTGELDRSVQEMLQLARQQDALAQKAKQNPSDGDLRSEQSALQEGVEKASERLQEQSKKSALVSPRSQKAVGDAEQRVGQAARDASEPRNAGQMPASMSDAAGALRQAAASLARDRERAGLSNSASGLSELLAQLQQLARQQGALNGQMRSLFQQGAQQGAQQREGLSPDAKEKARGLARDQRDVANQLDEAGDADGSGRSAELAREARALARALEQGAIDPTIFERQQRLFTRMLDAGRTLENDQQDESSKRESRPGEQKNQFAPPNASASGRAAQKYRVPEWNELRGLNSEERRLVIEYFRRLNGEKP